MRLALVWVFIQTISKTGCDPAIRECREQKGVQFTMVYSFSTHFTPASGQANFWCKVHLSGALLVYSDWCKMKEQYERDL